MKTIVMTVFVVTALFLVGCTTFPKGDIKIESDANPQIDFSGYKTYAWVDAAGIINDPDGYWEPKQFDADAVIPVFIDEVLRKRGMSEVSVDPNLLAAYALGVDRGALKIKQEPGTQLITLKNVPQTALLVTLIDPDTGYVVWASKATADLKNLGQEQTKKRLQYAINTMFNDLPK